jgi:uncharacterized protein (TIRG00374 family)
VRAFADFNWWYAPVIIACSSTNYFFRYWKWDYYTATLGIRPDRPRNLVIFFASFMMAVTPGKFGEVLKSYLLKKVNGTPISVSAPIVLVERLTDFIGLIILILAGAWVFGYGRVWVVTFAVFFTGLTILLSWKRGSETLIGLLRHVPVVNKFVDHAFTMYESIYTLIQPRPLFISTVLSVAAWACECFGFFLILHVFGAPPTLLKSTFIYAFSTIFGAVTMLPGGLGATEGSLTALTVIAGATKEIAVAATFLIRAATLWYAVIIGVVVTFAFQKRLNMDVSEVMGGEE